MTKTTEPRKATARKPLSKKLRFEVFKRDSFKCQYCGAEAPNVLLHVDHIQPVAEGGADEILNLITACEGCNLGKGARPLSDDSAVAKQRIQLEGLQERQEQLQMMMEWQRGLRDLKEQTVEELAEFWHDLAPGWVASDSAKTKIKRWLRDFGVGEITEAMNVAAEQYLENDPEHEGKVTRESWGFAFGKIPAICRVTRDSKDNPDLKDLLYIRGILRKRLAYVNEPQAMDWLVAARSWDVSVAELRKIALAVSSWTRFTEAVDDAIERQKKLDGEGSEG